MSEFDSLKNEGEQYAKDHPQQVHEAEQDAGNAVKSKLDPDGGQRQDDQQNQAGDQDPGAGQRGQGQQSQQGDAQRDQNGQARPATGDKARSVGSAFGSGVTRAHGPSPVDDGGGP